MIGCDTVCDTYKHVQHANTLALTLRWNDTLPFKSLLALFVSVIQTYMTTQQHGRVVWGLSSSWLICLHFHLQNQRNYWRSVLHTHFSLIYTKPHTHTVGICRVTVTEEGDMKEKDSDQMSKQSSALHSDQHVTSRGRAGGDSVPVLSW